MQSLTSKCGPMVAIHVSELNFSNDRNLEFGFKI
jgi:hypothetical protein